MTPLGRHSENGGGSGSCGAGGGGTLNYSDNGVTVTANTYFIPPGGGGAPQTTEANVDVAAPAAAAISNLQVSVSAATAAGMTLLGTLTVAQNTWRDFLITMTAAGPTPTFNMRSIGTGTYS